MIEGLNRIRMKNRQSRRKRTFFSQFKLRLQKKTNPFPLIFFFHILWLPFLLRMRDIASGSCVARNSIEKCFLFLFLNKKKNTQR